MASTVLTKTPTAGNRLKWTFSTWFKFNPGGQCIFGGNQDSNNYNVLQFSGTSQIDFLNVTSGSIDARLITNRLFRDTSAWYHVVAVWDSANASAGDRMRLYINGVEETSFATDTNPSSSLNSIINSANELSVGGYNSGSYFSGSMAHSHFCDGYAYAASDFGETDSTSGIWVAKTSPSVSYGSNGFFFKYQNNAAFGDDSSGNNNDFALSGTMTQTKDTPDNNFSTGSSILRQGYPGSITIANGNNTITDGGSDTTGLMSTIGVSSGKWYVEFKRISGTNSYIGVCGASEMNEAAYNNELGVNTLAIGLKEDGNILVANSSSSFSGTYTNGDVISVALDMDNDKVYFAKDGAWATGSGAWDSTTFDAAVGAQAVNTGDDTYVFGCSVNTSSTSINFGNGYFGTTAVTSAEADGNGEGQFEYAPPTGYFALCTNNLGSES